MNKPWQTSKSIFTVLFSGLLIASCLTGCYSGWNRPKQSGDGGDRQQDKPPSQSKPFGFLLLEVVRPSVEPGQNDCGNGDSPSLVAFRQHEWYEREVALTKALTPLTEKFVRNEIIIAGSDCQTMQSLELRAGSASPTGSDLVPSGTDKLGRPLVHLKVILWAGAAPALNAMQLPETFKNPWADWRVLAFQGVMGLKSYHQFVLADQSGGVFNSWQDSLPWDSWTNGTSIQNITPTDQATADRRVTIANDTQALVQWLVSSATGSASGTTTGPITPMGSPSTGTPTFPGKRSGSDQKPKLNPNGHH